MTSSVASESALYGGLARGVSLAVALAISVGVLAWPTLVMTADGGVDHGWLTLLMWGMAAGFVHGVGHRLPTFDLRIAPQAWRRGPAQPLLRNARRFGDDQPRGGPLTIIFSRQFVRHEAGAGAPARQRCHDDAIWRLDSAQRDRIEKRCGHKSSSFHFLRDAPTGRRYGPQELWTRSGQDNSG